MNDYAIKVQNVTKKYKLYNKNLDRVRDSLGLTRKPLYHEHYALSDINFDIKAGETVGIIGTNGAGKSTLLKIITGVVNPTQGHLEIAGRIAALLELGTGFNQEYTGLENIYLNGTMLGFTKEEMDAKLDDIIEFADIGDFINQPVKMYSSGMFVRLAFSVSINTDPEILIVDEALSVGDVYFQAKCFKKFEEFKKRGKTILFVSHDLSSVSRYCDRVILLNKGKKLAEGMPGDMIDLYKKVMVNQVDVDAIIAAQQEHNYLDASSQEKRDDILKQVIAKATDSSNFKSSKDALAKGEWSANYDVNPNLNEYGEGKANIVDFAIVDSRGNFTTALEKGSEFEIRSKVKFNEDIENPIFTYTFRNIQGVDITGTNTMFEGVDVDVAKAGETYVASFKQQMNLQGGEYMLSIACTGYVSGQFVVYHRLYDLLNITVISHKDTVGFFDMNSTVNVEKTEA